MASAPVKLNISDLTTEVPDGPGVFDVMMKSIKNHIQEEYEENRITGEEYTKAYITASIDYRTSNIMPAELSQINKNIETTEAQRQLTLANKLIADYNLESVLPANVDQTTKQTTQIEQTTVGLTYRNTDILPEEKRQLIYQTDHVMRSNVEKLEFEVSDLLPQQRDNLIKDAAIKDYQLSSTLVQQLALLKEQTEVQHAQTKDTRIDGSPVTGAVGKQKDLYSQQIDSYKKDARYKVGKMYLDSWITQKSLDEGLNAPNQLTNANIDAVLASLRSDNILT